MTEQLQNINIARTRSLISPAELSAALPVDPTIAANIATKRKQVTEILNGDDQRLILIVGPCSIHDPQIATEYATRLHALSQQVNDRLMLVMRVYFEKPRTTVGWKGLINDPFLNGTFDISTGIKLAREILLNVTRLGLPVATEMLEPITPQYIADLVTMASIGARTTESPTHRQMASGLSMPVGFKNSTEGSLDIATNAMQAAEAPHNFLGINDNGEISIVETKGNKWGHLILRGGRTGPNYNADSLAIAKSKLTAAGLSPRFVVDCSHANSNKDYTRQSIVFNDVVAQRAAGNSTIVGLMVESNLEEGKQPLKSPEELAYVSITDGCIGWEETKDLILSAHQQLA